MSQPCRQIISVDGGGTKGYFSFYMLREIRHVIPDIQIDLLVGVSVGAIICALLATELIDQLDDSTIEQYVMLILSDKNNNTSNTLYSTPIYGNKKSQILHQLFRDRLFGDVCKPLAIIVDQLDDDPVVMRSWDPVYSCIPLYQILDASSAVPGLFPQRLINARMYMDGGLAANQPTGIAYPLLRQLYHDIPDEQIWLLSLGTTMIQHKVVQSSSDGFTQVFAQGIISKLFRSGGAVADIVVEQLMQTRYLRLAPNIITTLMDENIRDICRQCATLLWIQKGPWIITHLYHLA